MIILALDVFQGVIQVPGVRLNLKAAIAYKADDYSTPSQRNHRGRNGFESDINILGYSNY